nr:protein QUIRKY [Tanacetum cinerariifolium]
MNGVNEEVGNIEESCGFGYRSGVWNNHTPGIEEDFNSYREEFDGSGRMIRVGYEKECCQVYINVRRDVLDECLEILGVEKLSIEEVQRLEEKQLWIQGVCFDLTDVPVCDPPDSPLAPQWARRGVMNNHTASFYWHANLVFVAGEPLEDSLILLLEGRTRDDLVLLGHVLIPVAAIEQRS